MSKQDTLQESILQVPSRERVITPQEARNYEAGRIGLIVSLWFLCFPRLFAYRCKCNYRIYKEFMDGKEKLRQEKAAFLRAVNNFYEGGGKLH